MNIRILRKDSILRLFVRSTTMQMARIAMFQRVIDDDKGVLAIDDVVGEVK